MEQLRREGDTMIAAKLQRYREYFQIKLLTVTVDAALQLRIIMEKGMRDVNDRRGGGGQFDQCEKQCLPGGNGGIVSCALACLEQIDPVGANMMRCIELPDGLPF
jgi:hypothetical protein